METKTIYCLEGAPEIEFTFCWRTLKRIPEFEIKELTNLYAEPDKLYTLAEENPFGIFVGTTGIRDQHRPILIETFKKTGYIPTIIIFADDESTFAYQSIARELKENHGTKIYHIDIFSDEIYEVNWI